MNSIPAPKWMRIALIAAAIYNLAWGSWVILRPLDWFTLTGMDPPLYPGIWQCVGMIVGVYGIGYAIASTDPLRHWPITLVGLLGKIFGPIGFLFTWLTVPAGQPGHLPLSWGLLNVTNDLIWWIPFAAILFQSFKASIDPRNKALPGGDGADGGVPADLSVGEANESFVTQRGESLAALSRQSPLLVLFLRHSGCTFCREALADLQTCGDQLKDHGIRPVLVHMSNPAAAAEYLPAYGLQDIDQVSDPECQLYRAYGLQRGRFGQLLGWRVWWRGFKAAILAGHGVGKLDGDGFQMPGAFLVQDNQVVRSYRHQTVSDRPDLCDLAVNGDSLDSSAVPAAGLR